MQILLVILLAALQIGYIVFSTVMMGKFKKLGEARGYLNAWGDFQTWGETRRTLGRDMGYIDALSMFSERYAAMYGDNKK